MAFVVITSTLLYLALGTATTLGAPLPPESGSKSWPLPVVFLLLSLVIGTIGFVVFRAQSSALKNNDLNGLNAVAELKVEGITRWLAERRANARSLSGGPVIGAAVARWLKNNGDDDRRQLLDTLRTIRENYGFADVVLLDLTGRPLLGDNLGDTMGSAAAVTPARIVSEALASNQPQFIDLERRPKDGAIGMGFVAPLYQPETGSTPRQPLGAIRFNIRPDSFLYPFLASWPLKSTTGESFLARRDGDTVLYLSPLRYRPDAALTLSLPLTSPDLPVARALLLEGPVIEGRDYRQVPVLETALPVPGTPWMLLSKMDEEEALTGTRRLLAVTGILIAASLCVSAAVLILLWQRQRLRWAYDKLAQSQRVASSEAKFRSYIEHSPLAVYVVDEDGRFVETNPAGLALAGHDAATLRTMTITDILIEEDRERARSDFADLARTGVMEAEYQVLTPDGSPLYILVRAVKISETRFIGFSQDITERKQAEAQIQALNADLERRVDERTAELVGANRELDSFAYAVSHDLRAPLRAMGGFSAALIEDHTEHLNDEARSHLGNIITASRKMGELVEGLLVLSRSTRGELQRDRVDVSALAAAIQLELTRTAPGRAVECRIEPGLQVRGDARMIDVVLRNLLSNAWKYTRHTAAPVVRVYRSNQDDQEWICVADNGAGFDMAHAGKLFKPFQRLHREDEFPGIGIGLATVQRIVHRHGGTIIGEGAVGRGATFRFSLPSPVTGNAP